MAFRTPTLAVLKRGAVSRRGWWGLAFVLPVVIFFLIFSTYPILSGFYLSLTNFTMLKPPVFIGFDNYRRIFSDRLFQDALVVTIKFVVGTTFPVWILSLLAAILFFQKFPGRSLLRAIFYSPLIPSAIVVAIIWRVLLHPSGVLTNLLLPLTGQAEIRWLTDRLLSPLSMIIMNDWATIPFFMLIWLAGLSGIPEELREAAVIDGANKAQSFLFVEFPLLRPTAVFIVTISIIQSFQSFTFQYLLSPDKGGPIDVNTTLGLLIWKYGFVLYKMGDAAAISVILCAIVLSITALQLWWNRNDDYSIR